MKIDNIILSVDENEIYMSFWPYVSEIWHHLCVRPILFYCTNDISAPFPYPSRYGKIVPIPALRSRLPFYNGCMSRMLAAAATPGTNYITDIDLLPCSRRPLDIIENKLSNNTIATYLYKQMFNGCGIIATSDLFKRIYMANGIIVDADSFWTEEIAEKLEATSSYPSAWWCADEVQFNMCVNNYKKTNKVHVEMMSSARMVNVLPDGKWKNNSYYPTIEDIKAGKAHWSFDGIRNNMIWQLHFGNDRSKKLTAYVRDIILETIQ
jgi:hypothetical protein